MIPLGKKGLDWAGLMRAGLFGLRLPPTVFWSLTPIELSIMLGAEAKAKPLTRQRLEELAAAFPDKDKDHLDEPDRRPAGSGRNA